MSGPAPDTATSHPYTCNTCLVAFKNSELQRGHMQSDWHRYNLKRRVASLPPLSSEIFTEKVLANQATAAATAARASFERICTVCDKTYFSVNAYQNHLASQKHRIKVAQTTNGSVAPTEDETNSVISSAFSLGDSVDTRPADRAADVDISEVVSGVTKVSLSKDPGPVRPALANPVADRTKPGRSISPSDGEGDSTADEKTAVDDSEPLLQCLFCSLKSGDMSENTGHMRAAHGMFVPEQKYLVDLEGLLKWLHGRVRYLHECLYCGMVRHTTTGVQTHMRDKGHCMIEFESEEQMVEIGQFYDFRSTYSDDESASEEGDSDTDYTKPRASKLGARRDVQADVDAEDGGTDGAGWETDDSDQEILDNEDAKDQQPPKHKRNRKAAEPQHIYHDDDGLHLPTGRLAGHRSLARYFRQNLRNYPTPEERANRRALTEGSADDADSSEGNQSIARRGHDIGAVSRANGGTGMLGVSDAKKREAAAIEKSDRTRAQRQQSRYQAGNERRANMQKHFRDPLLQ